MYIVSKTINLLYNGCPSGHPAPFFSYRMILNNFPQRSMRKERLK